MKARPSRIDALRRFSYECWQGGHRTLGRLASRDADYFELRIATKLQPAGFVPIATLLKNENNK